MENIPTYLLLNGNKIDSGNLALVQDDALRLFLSQWWNENDYIEQQTSGSTGTPKIIRIKKMQMINSARMTLQFFSLQKKSTALLCLPVNYIAGRMMVIRAIIGEMQLRQVNSNTHPLDELRDEEQFDFAAMIPAQADHSLTQRPGLFQQIKNIIIGGGEISSSLLEKIKRMSNNCYATYAMTETITHIALKKLNGEKAQDSFQLLKGIRVDQDERGCLIIDAPQLNDEKLFTNDIVEFTDLDKFRWIGRFDNVINSGGIKIFPEQLEEIYAGLLTDRRYFVAGEKDEKFGERAVLVLEGNPLDRHTEKLLLNHLKEISPKHHSPQKIYYSKHFSETPTGKIQRKESLLNCITGD